MSTRSTIQFKQGEEKATIYKHWDGYPSNIVPMMQEFVKWNKGANDVSYTTANFIFWAKYTELVEAAKSGAKEMNDRAGKPTPPSDEIYMIQAKFLCQEDCTLGYGVTGNTHNDEEWFYIIDADKKKIIIRRNRDRKQFSIGFNSKPTQARLEAMEQ